MTVSEFERIREAVLACIDLPVRERAEYLGALARHDPELAAAVRVLAAHDSDALATSLDRPGPRTRDGDDEAHELPARIGRYAIRRRLGAGGMGVVYVGVDDVLDREIAIKVLSDPVTADDAGLERFRGEARLLARVNHPHIATIYSLEHAGGEVLLTMELVQGRTLAERLRRGPCRLDEALMLARQIASALEAAHREGVVHRDLKPSNVVLSEHHGAKVLDFGLAALVEAGSGTRAHGDDTDRPVSGHSSQTGSLGTPGYMSPEQIRGSGVEPRTDVWAFGCVLYECLTAVPLFGGALHDRLRATLDDTPELSELPSDVPPRLREIIEACVQKPVEMRPGIEDVRAAIDRVQESRELMRARRRMQAVGPDPTLERAARLPFSLTRFIGRERELSEIGALTERARLVSIVGLGGAGKTRLAVEAARRLLATGEDVVFVDLTALPDGDALADVVLDAVQPERVPGGDVRDALVASLSDKHCMLILDNCEQIREPVAQLTMYMLAPCPGVSALVTSREPLGVPGEQVFALSPLALPDARTTSPERLLEFDAVALLVDRARDVAPSFAVTPTNADAVAALCHRLDGLPLAIEFAAALASVLAPDEILARVERRLASIDHGAEGIGNRGAGLTAVLDDTFDRLSPTEQRVLRRLSVFRGGLTLAAAERVVSGEAATSDVIGVLAELIRKSLVIREEAPAGGGSRYRLLETVRTYAEAKLDEAGERSETADRHLEYFANFATSIRIVGPAQSSALASIQVEMDNVRAILRRVDARVRAALATGEGAGAETTRVVLAAQVAAGFCGYWIRTGRWHEGRRSCEDAKRCLLEVGETNRAEYVRLGRNLGEIAVAQGDLDAARGHLSEAREAAETLADPNLAIGVLNNLGTVERSSGRFETARRLFDRAIELRRQHPDEWDLSGIVFNRGVASALGGALDDACDDFTESLRIKRALGDERGIAHALNALGLVATQQGRFDAARPFLEESLAIKRELDDRPGVVTTLMNLGLNALDRFVSLDETPSLLDEARDWYDEALALAVEVGDRPNEAVIRIGLTWVALHQGRPDTAARECERSLALAEEVGNAHQEAASLLVSAYCRLFAGDAAAARRVGRHALDRLATSGVDHEPTAMELFSWAYRADGDAGRAATFLSAAEQYRELSGSGAARWRQARNDETRRWVDAVLGAQRLESARREGRALSDLRKALAFEIAGD